MTMTYDDLRGYRGYFTIATRVRARAHARNIQRAGNNPHYPANPARGRATFRHMRLSPRELSTDVANENRTEHQEIA